LVDAKLILSTTLSGYTARQIVRHRPVTPVVAVSPSAKTQRKMALVWGVDCLVVKEYFESTDNMLKQAVSALDPSLVSVGGRIVITAGVPFGSSGQTNLIQVHELA
jgi:pyruvate kinase